MRNDLEEPRLQPAPRPPGVASTPRATLPPPPLISCWAGHRSAGLGLKAPGPASHVVGKRDTCWRDLGGLCSGPSCCHWGQRSGRAMSRVPQEEAEAEAILCRENWAHIPNSEPRSTAVKGRANVKYLHGHCHCHRPEGARHAVPPPPSRPPEAAAMISASDVGLAASQNSPFTYWLCDLGQGT